MNNYKIDNNGIHPILDHFLNVPFSENYFENKGTGLAGKTALVTGGYKGIGLAIVKSFIREGANVIFTGRDAAGMKQIHARLNSANTAYMEWDITDRDNRKSLMEKAFSLFGPFDILVNNAGINKLDGKYQKFLEMTEKYVIAINKTNVTGTHDMCETYIGLLGEKKGKIINIVSNTAFRGAREAYFCSKWAILSYTKALGNKYRGRITVNGIAPGPVKTDMMWEEGQTIIQPSIPNSRFGLPEEIAEFALILAGKTGDLISGQVFLCDGGEVLK
jgi:NAD(P)-dependent dehydrogenase (short-subunit alcohol dehydrogenase family)